MNMVMLVSFANGLDKGMGEISLNKCTKSYDKVYNNIIANPLWPLNPPHPFTRCMYSIYLKSSYRKDKDVPWV
jgi:hypothetical protein